MSRYYSGAYPAREATLTRRHTPVMQSRATAGRSLFSGTLVTCAKMREPKVPMSIIKRLFGGVVDRNRLTVADDLGQEKTFIHDGSKAVFPPVGTGDTPAVKIGDQHRDAHNGANCSHYGLIYASHILTAHARVNIRIWR